MEKGRISEIRTALAKHAATIAEPWLVILDVSTIPP
jgi:hypothetical protein